MFKNKEDIERYNRFMEKYKSKIEAEDLDPEMDEEMKQIVQSSYAAVDFNFYKEKLKDTYISYLELMYDSLDHDSRMEYFKRFIEGVMLFHSTSEDFGLSDKDLKLEDEIKVLFENVLNDLSEDPIYKSYMKDDKFDIVYFDVCETLDKFIDNSGYRDDEFINLVNNLRWLII